jgi:hypothetical protein
VTYVLLFLGALAAASLALNGWLYSRLKATSAQVLATLARIHQAETRLETIRKIQASIERANSAEEKIQAVARAGQELLKP